MGIISSAKHPKMGVIELAIFSICRKIGPLSIEAVSGLKFII
jgi:hypothetical protein